MADMKLIVSQSDSWGSEIIRFDSCQYNWFVAIQADIWQKFQVRGGEEKLSFQKKLFPTMLLVVGVLMLVVGIYQAVRNIVAPNDLQVMYNYNNNNYMMHSTYNSTIPKMCLWRGICFVIPVEGWIVRIVYTSSEKMPKIRNKNKIKKFLKNLKSRSPSEGVIYPSVPF